jgi:hypothetical protein
LDTIGEYPVRAGAHGTLLLGSGHVHHQATPTSSARCIVIQPATASRMMGGRDSIFLEVILITLPLAGCLSSPTSSTCLAPKPFLALFSACLGDRGRGMTMRCHFLRCPTRGSTPQHWVRITCRDVGYRRDLMVRPSRPAAARRKREQDSIELFRTNMAKHAVRTLQDLHRFVFSSHMAYSASRLQEVRARRGGLRQSKRASRDCLIDE